MAKGLPPALTKTVKGLPVYVWLLLLASAIVITLYLRKRNTEDESTEEPIDEESAYTPYPGSEVGNTGEIGAADLSGITDAIGGLSDDIGAGFADMSDSLLGVTTQFDDARADALIDHAETLEAIDESRGVSKKDIRTIVKNQTKKAIARDSRKGLSKKEKRDVRKIVRPNKKRKRVAMTGGSPPRVMTSRIDTRRIQSGRGW